MSRSREADDSSRITSQLLSEEARPEAQEITLDDLGSIYRGLTQARGSDPLLRVVSLQDRLMVQFPEVSRQLLFVRLQKIQRPREALSFVLRLDWSGPDQGPLSTWQFLRGELRDAWWVLLPVSTGALCSFVLLHDTDVMATVNRLALTSVSIFLSIFVVFVIGESKWLGSRLDLFRSGRLHEFLDADRMMIKLAILALLLAFTNAALLESPNDLALVAGRIDLEHAWGPLLTTVVLLLLIDLFLAIPRYYLRRLRTMVERDAIREILVQGGERGVRPVPPPSSEENGRT